MTGLTQSQIQRVHQRRMYLSQQQHGRGTAGSNTPPALGCPPSRHRDLTPTYCTSRGQASAAQRQLLNPASSVESSPLANPPYSSSSKHRTPKHPNNMAVSQSTSHSNEHADNGDQDTVNLRHQLLLEVLTQLDNKKSSDEAQVAKRNLNSNSGIAFDWGKLPRIGSVHSVHGIVESSSVLNTTMGSPSSGKENYLEQDSRMSKVKMSELAKLILGGTFDGFLGGDTASEGVNKPTVYSRSINLNQELPTIQVQRSESEAFNQADGSGAQVVVPQTPVVSTMAGSNSQSCLDDRQLGDLANKIIGSFNEKTRPNIQLHQTMQGNSNRVAASNYNQTGFAGANQSYGNNVTQGHGRAITRGPVGTVSQGHVGTISQGPVGTVSQGHVRTVSQGHVGTISQGHVGTVSQGHVGNISQRHVGTVNQGHVGIVNQVPLDAVNQNHVRTANQGHMGIVNPSHVGRANYGHVGAVNQNHVGTVNQRHVGTVNQRHVGTINQSHVSAPNLGGVGNGLGAILEGIRDATLFHFRNQERVRGDSIRYDPSSIPPRIFQSRDSYNYCYPNYPNNREARTARVYPLVSSNSFVPTTPHVVRTSATTAPKTVDAIPNARHFVQRQRHDSLSCVDCLLVGTCPIRKAIEASKDKDDVPASSSKDPSENDPDLVITKVTMKNAERGPIQRIDVDEWVENTSSLPERVKVKQEPADEESSGTLEKETNVRTSDSNSEPVITINPDQSTDIIELSPIDEIPVIQESVIPQATSSLDKTPQEPTSTEETTSNYENMVLQNSSHKTFEKVAATHSNTGSIQNWISDNIGNSTQENVNAITNTTKAAFNNEQRPMAHGPANANVSEPSADSQGVNEYDKGDRNYEAFVSLEQSEESQPLEQDLVEQRSEENEPVEQDLVEQRSQESQPKSVEQNLVEQRSQESQPKSVEQDLVEQRSEGNQSKRLETEEIVIAEKGSGSALSFSDVLTKVMDVKDKLLLLKLEKALEENKEKLNTQTVTWIRKNTLKARLKILKRIEKLRDQYIFRAADAIKELSRANTQVEQQFVNQYSAAEVIGGLSDNLYVGQQSMDGKASQSHEEKVEETIQSLAEQLGTLDEGSLAEQLGTLDEGDRYSEVHQDQEKQRNMNEVSPLNLDERFNVKKEELHEEEQVVRNETPQQAILLEDEDAIKTLDDIPHRQAERASGITGQSQPITENANTIQCKRKSLDEEDHEIRKREKTEEKTEEKTDTSNIWDRLKSKYSIV